jgi:hypothetical protein
MAGAVAESTIESTNASESMLKTFRYIFYLSYYRFMKCTGN